MNTGEDRAPTLFSTTAQDVAKRLTTDQMAGGAG